MVLGERQIDQHAGLLPGAGEAAPEELARGRLVSLRMLDGARHQGVAQLRPGQDETQHERHRELDQEDARSAERREPEQRPGHRQGCEQGPEQGDGAVMARLLGNHEYDLAGGVVLHVADRLGEARLILG